MQKMYAVMYFEFSAHLIGTDAAPWDEILEWYRREASYWCQDEDELPELTVQHLGGGLFRGVFIPGENTPTDIRGFRNCLESFVDPDEDGNHPIRCGGQEYLVRGELLNIDGEPVVVED